jgi:hypothetical protein
VPIAALVQQVGDELDRAHALFGDPMPAGHVSALDSGAALTTAGDLVRTGHARIAAFPGIWRPVTAGSPQARDRRSTAWPAPTRHSAASYRQRRIRISRGARTPVLCAPGPPATRPPL